METRENMFVKAADFRPVTYTENGALALSTTGSKIVDQFGKAGGYRGRDIHEVFDDQKALWNENPLYAIRFPFYLRMITRKTDIGGNRSTESVQNGQGSRDEAFKRLLWFAKYQKDVFNDNIWLLPVVGSWKDLWTIMYYDFEEDINAIDRDVIYFVIQCGLASDVHVNLVKKYMPRIKSMKKCTTHWTQITNMLAKEFAEYLGISVKEYNKLKASGTAHDFQKIICARRYDEINWNKIPGRALSILSCGKFLDNHGLTDSYIKWIDSQPIAKFTGYVYELSKKVREFSGGNYLFSFKKLPYAAKHTIDAQFECLVDQARRNGNITENVLVGLDTSGSMMCPVKGLKGVCCSDIANSLALFFGELNTGAFHNKLFMFDNTTTAYDVTEDSFCDRVLNLPRVPCGGTNFQSIITELLRIRLENPDIPLDDYPKTILVVSDMQFNPTSWSRGKKETTNLEFSKETLKQAFPYEYVDSIKFIWWDCAGRRSTYESDSKTEGSYFFSGFDGSIISMLLNEQEAPKGEKKAPLTAEEMVAKALSQEILEFVKV